MPDSTGSGPRPGGDAGVEIAVLTASFSSRPGAEESLLAALSRYVVEKGSIAVDGVSLTVAAVVDGEFTVGLIPATLQATTLGSKLVGGSVNLEVDVLAKHVERLLDSAKGAKGEVP